MSDGDGLLLAFTGGSASWPGMGRTLYARHRPFRDAIDDASTVVDAVLGWDPSSHFRGTDAPPGPLALSRRNDILLLGLLQLAQVDLWRSEGVIAEGVVSVSLGEMVAPYAAGAISRADCARILAVVSHAISRTAGSHTMFLLKADGVTAQGLCTSAAVAMDYLGSVSPDLSAVLSRAVDAPIGRRHVEGVMAREVATDWNYHTPRLDVDRAWMSEQLAGVVSQPVSIPIYSSAAGGRIVRAPIFDAAFFAWMVSRPFRFDDALAAAFADGFRTVVNLGPQPANNPFLTTVAQSGGHTIQLVDTMVADDEDGAWQRATAIMRTRSRRPRLRPGISATTVSLTDPGAESRLFEVYEALREAGPTQHLVRAGSWIVLDYEGVQHALSHPLLFSSRTPVMREIDPVLLGNDPPAHTAMRKLLGGAFSPAAIARRAAVAQHKAARLLDPLRSGRSIDAIAGFAAPLAHTIAADLIGVREDAVPALVECARAARGDMRSVYALVDGPLHDAAPRLYDELTGDGGLDAAAARALTRLLWLTAVTPQRLLGSAILLLLEHPDIRSAIAAQPRLLEPFMEEAIRLHPGEHLLPRVTTAETRLGGQTIPAGAPVNLCLAAANRDPARFSDPSSIHLTGRGRGHLSFGAGIHRCIGASLARAVIMAGLGALLDAAPQLRAAQPLSTVRYAQGAWHREVEHLLVAP